MAIVFDETSGRSGSSIVFDEPDSPSSASIAFDDDQGDPSLGKLGAGFVTDLAIAEGGRTASTLAGAAIGTAILPGVGTAIGGSLGYVLGGLGFGAAGSIARQKILNPEEEIDEGQLVADSLTSLIPGFKGAKGLSFAGRVALQSGVGAGISTGSVAIERAVNEDRLPTIEELRNAGLTGAVLGGALGVTGEKMEGILSKYAGMSNRDFTKAFRRGDSDAQELVGGLRKTGRDYEKEAAKNIQEVFTGISDGYSDSLIRARILQDVVAEGQYTKKDAPLKVKSDESDYYAVRRLAEGKIAAKNQEMDNLVKADAIFMANKAKELGADATDLSRSLNQYLYAKHGIAYNKANKAKFKGKGGASGKTDKEHQDVIDNFESRGLNKSLSESLDIRKNLSKRILDTLEDGGLVKPDVAAKLRKQFPDYVPLNRIMDTDELDDIPQKAFSSSGSYEVQSSGLKSARGSERDVDEISNNILSNLVQATRRAEVNKANQAFLKLLRDNPETSKGIATIKKPQIISTKNVKDTSPQAEALRAQGKKVAPKKVPVYKDADKNALTVFENGERLFVEFNDPRLAAALKGTNKEQVGQILKFALAFNRFVGGLYTRWSPDFVIPNLVRDRSEALVNAMAKMSPGQAFKILNPTGDMATIYRNLRGQKATSEGGKKLDAIYKEFVDAGGQTGGLGLSTLEGVEENIDKLAKSLNQPTASKVKIFNNFFKGANEIVENSTRFATYRRARADGKTPQQAALAARDSSFDPQLQGSKGDTIRALYLFSNPAIQGAKNFIRSMKNPKVALGVMGALTSSAYVLDQYNKSIDPDYRDKIPEWKLNKHLTFVRGKNPDGSLKYVSVPIGYSMVPFKMAADYAQRVLIGGEEIDPKVASKDLFQGIIDSYNPVGGSPVPTILRPFTEIAENKDGLGRDIRPKQLETQNISEVEKIHPWTARTQGGELAFSLAEQLQDMGYETSPENILYLYRTYTGGPGKTVERLFDVTAKLWNGEEVKARDVPIARRFFGETYAEAFENRTGREQRIENLDKQENTNSAVAYRLASDYILKLRNAETIEEKSQIASAMLSDPKANASVVRRVDKFLKDEALGITPEDKRVRNLNVDTRVKHYLQELSKMTPEEGSQYLLEQKRKRVLSPSVEEKLMGMKAFRDFFQR